MTDAIATRKHNAVALVNQAREDFQSALPVDQQRSLNQWLTHAQLVLVENEKVAEVMKVNPSSAMLALHRTAALGLDPTPSAKQVYFIPRGREITLNVSYIGYIELMMRTGLIERIESDVLHENDVVEFDADETPRIIAGGQNADSRARFLGKAVRGEPIASYAYARYKDGTRSNVVIADVDRVKRAREASESYKRDKKNGTSYSPWNNDPVAMIRKTAIHDLVKWVDISTEDWREKARLESMDATGELTLAASKAKALEALKNAEAMDGEVIEEEPAPQSSGELISQPMANEIISRARAKWQVPSAEALDAELANFFQAEGLTLGQLTVEQGNAVLAELAK